MRRDFSSFWRLGSVGKGTRGSDSELASNQKVEDESFHSGMQPEMRGPWCPSGCYTEDLSVSEMSRHFENGHTNELHCHKKVHRRLS